jgi:chromosome segregation protein
VVEQAREVVSALNVEQAELRVREESIAEALRRDADCDEDTALTAPRPDLAADADPDALLESLEAKLKRLGPVNPLAAAEYQELEERAGFLEAQLADLDESRTELRKVIVALDEEIGRLFVAAFEEIATNFAENFSILFPGGTGKITLSHPDDPLTTGVDIFAQPMGKKVDRLQLLSGGERSLAALAFLFAVFRSRPSPFYVLDEVEAALDDANLRRFLRLVDTLRDTSQLLVVTHQQQTMEVADILYGVTMEPGESSRVIARRMSEVVAGT